MRILIFFIDLFIHFVFIKRRWWIVKYYIHKYFRWDKITYNMMFQYYLFSYSQDTIRFFPSSVLPLRDKYRYSLSNRTKIRKFQTTSKLKFLRIKIKHLLRHLWMTMMSTAKKKVFLKCFCSDGRGIPIFGWKCTRSDTQYLLWTKGWILENIC